MRRLSLLMLGLGLCAMVWYDPIIPGLLNAQPPPIPANMGGGRSALGLKKADRVFEQGLRKAEKDLEAGHHSDAVRLLQQILNIPQDGFFQPDPVNEPTHFLSLKQRATFLLENSSPEAKAAYELQFGAEARDLLSSALQRQDIAVARDLVRRFLHTKAGAEGAFWLGCYFMDRGDYASALPSLEQARRQTSSSTLEPSLTLRIALCSYQLQSTRKAVELVEAITQTLSRPVTVAGYELKPRASAESALAWLKRVAGRSLETTISEPTGWLTVRGNSARNPSIHSSPPLGRSLWQTSLTKWTIPSDKTPEGQETRDVSQVMESLKAVHMDKGLFPLPCSIPLLVNDIVVVRFVDHLAGFDVKSGQEVWRSVESDGVFNALLQNLDTKEEVSNPFSRQTRNFRESFSILMRQRAWEDLSHGSLSSNGDLVFCIEDLGFISDIASEITTGRPHRLAMRDYNRMCAYEASTGRLRWEVGGPRGDVSLDLAGTFFLGPPLPAGGLLYCLVENQFQVQLLVLDARNGKLVWQQSLTQSVETHQAAPARRRMGISPALMGDLLVCPSGDNLVTSVNLGSRSLAWAYQYSSSNSAEGQDIRIMRQRILMLNGGRANINMDALKGAEVNEWQDGSPIVTSTHALVTPRDSQELHCLSLDDGKLLWKRPRKEGLYVAGVQEGLVIVVSGRSVEALKVTDGEPAWAEAVALMNQAGRGILTSKYVLLPLVTGEIVSLDIKSGRTLSRSRVYERESLGNLIPGPGIVLSQTPETLQVFRTYDAISSEVARRLAQNPEDPEALAQRGSFRLSQGDTANGQADLRLSLKLKPTPDAESQLFDSLFDQLKSDFNSYQQLLPELQALARSDSDRLSLYRVWAMGLMANRDFQAGAEVLIKLSELPPSRNDLERLDGRLSMRTDHWVRLRFQELQRQPDANLKRTMDTLLSERADSVIKSGQAEEMRKFLRNFGGLPAADTVRMAFARTLLKQGYSIELEHVWSRLRQQDIRPELAEFLSEMIQKLIQENRIPEAHVRIRELSENFGTIALTDNKTGNSLATELTARVTQPTMISTAWPEGQTQVTTTKSMGATYGFLNEIYLEGPEGEFFKNHQFKVDSSMQRVVGIDGWGKDRWALPLSEAISNLVYSGASKAQVRNHIVLLTSGLVVTAINVLPEKGGIRAKRLWSSPLIEGQAEERGPIFQIAVNRPGNALNRRMVMINQAQTPVGMVGAMTDESVCILRGRQLSLVNLLTGEPVWRRTDMIPGSEIFGDEESVYVVPQETTEVTRIDRESGQTIETRPIAPVYSRLLTFDHFCLSYIENGAIGAFQFQLTDLRTGQVTWQQRFKHRSQYSVIGEETIAVLEPDGALTVLNVKDGTVRWNSRLVLEPNARDFGAITDGKYLLVLSGEVPPRAPQLPPRMAVNGNHLLMTGKVICFDFESGQLLWSEQVTGMALDQSWSRHCPVWVFSVRTTSQQMRPQVQVLALDKRSGRRVLDLNEENHINYYRIALDPEAHRLTLSMMGPAETVYHKVLYTGEAITGETPAKGALPGTENKNPAAEPPPKPANETPPP